MKDSENGKRSEQTKVRVPKEEFRSFVNIPKGSAFQMMGLGEGREHSVATELLETGDKVHAFIFG